MAILVTGGAGYIGSHTVAELLQKQEEVDRCRSFGARTSGSGAWRKAV